MRRWSWRLEECVKLLLQCVHWKGLSPEWVRSCCSQRNEKRQRKTTGYQTWQIYSMQTAVNIYDFPAESVLTCFRFDVCEKDL